MTTPSPWADAEPRRRWIPPEEFVLMLENSGQGFIQAVEALGQQPAESWVEGFLSNLAREAIALERFLDIHGAKANQAFYALRKSVACTLWLSEALSCLVHLRGRLEVYPSSDEFWTRNDLPKRLKSTVNGLGELLLEISQELKLQWVTAGCEWSQVGDWELVCTLPPSRILVADRLRGEEKAEQGQDQLVAPAARLCNRFLEFYRSWEVMSGKSFEDPAELIKFFEEFCKERTTRSFKARAHNWQSDYDSLVYATKDELDWPELKCLRGAMSQSLHLLEAIVALSHLFERHRPGLVSANDGLGYFLESEQFLKLVVDGCVLPAYRSLEVGVEAAESLLSSLAKETYIFVQLPPGVRLHARPLSLLVRLTQHFGLPVTMSVNGASASAESLIQLLLLAGQNPDAKEYKFEGAAIALDGIRLLFESSLGENGIEGLPGELAFLKG
ncbi:MAG: hypothetical protein QM477_04195 [Planctomycetota bacterium]